MDQRYQMNRLVKKIILAIISLILLTQQSHACVGKVLHVGVSNSIEEQVFAEMVSVLLNERTGTTVNVTVYSGLQEIYSKVRNGDVNIVVQDTGPALAMLGITMGRDNAETYDFVKKGFHEQMNLTSLKPFGAITDESGNTDHFYFPVITQDVLINFPALPRVINKLSDISKDRGFLKMLDSVRAGEEPGKAVKDLLRKKKLI